MVALREFIVDRARALHIDMIGFTDGGPLVEIEGYLKDRKSMGIECEFEEKDIHKRIDPRASLENCKSIIVIGISYNTAFKPDYEARPRAILSKSSWGEDYHRVLRAKMEDLVGEIKNREDFDYKIFVDTGPLVDRELAKKAGLGYYGKNCSIINRDYGSFIFFGYILTSLDLDLKEKLVEEECGDCDLCLRACPTGALEGAYKLNPKTCLSYITQTKDLIPNELRDKMGNRIYGCDTCQLVCPKNKEVKFSRHEGFIPDSTGGLVDIEELLFMSNREFKEKYGFMSGAWRGKNILIRNAIINIGNTRDKRYIPLLERYRERKSRWDEYIQWAIDKILTDG